VTSFLRCRLPLSQRAGSLFFRFCEKTGFYAVTFKATTLQLQPESSAVRRGEKLAHSEASASEAGGVG